MNGLFLDTNILLRHLLNDHTTQSPACFRLVQSLERGEKTAWTTHLVVAEVVWVLSHAPYDVPRETIGELLLPIISLPGLRLPGKRMFQRVFDLYASQPIDYVDAYHVALVEQHGQVGVWSYDTHFDRIAGIERREPQ